MKDKSLGLVSVLRLKVPRLSVSYKFWNLSLLSLVSDEKFRDSLVPVLFLLLHLYRVLSRSRPDFVKLQSSLTVQSKSVGLGVDFVFPPSQLTN